MTRKITTILLALALALCLTLLPVGAGAASASDGHELTSNNGQLKCDGTNVTATTDVHLKVASNIPNDISGYVIGSGAYYLSEDVTIDKSLIITGGTATDPVTLDLCGHVLKYDDSAQSSSGSPGNSAKNKSVIVVQHGAYFVLKDTVTNPITRYAAKAEGSDVYGVISNDSSIGSIPVIGGVITGGRGTKVDGDTPWGGGVLVGNDAHFEMTGGNIVGCSANSSSSNGGGVYVGQSATFKMSGNSAIVGCAANLGGGVNVSLPSTFLMTGNSRIESCVATGVGGGGGGVRSQGTFTMSDNSTIQNCSTNSSLALGGGGVLIIGSSLSNSNFTMEGGSIKNCSATKGSGVYINNNATMDAQGGSVGDSVYISSNGGTLTNTSTTGGTAFYDEISGGTTSGKWVTFKDGDDSYKVFVSDGNTVSKPAAPQKTGKTFLGWVTSDPNADNTTPCKEFDFNTAVNDNLTLFAAWDDVFKVVVSGAQGSTTNDYYKTFDAAWSGAQGDSPTFKLLDNVGGFGSRDYTCSRKNATLDLNGKTLTANITISGNAGESNERVFTVKDTSSDEDGKLEGTITVTGSKAELTVDGGTVDKVVVTNGGTLKCSSGTITNLTVNGGTVNHTDTLGDYKSDNDNHWKVCSCCSTVVEKAAHTFGSDNQCVCGYEKPRRTYRGSSTPTVSAVLSHPDAASATNYTSGIYGLTFRSTASFASFRGVQVDGKTIASSNYIAEEGSIVVYLKAVYLQTLSKGSHTVTILSTEGNTTANFTIGGVQSAKTGDTGVAIYALMALTSYTGTALVVRGRKRK